ADTRVDDYLSAILDEVPRDCVVSGFGEPPALDHLQAFALAGFTAGAVCLAPRRSMAILHALQAGDFSAAQSLMAPIMPLEDLRQQINPIRVLHDAITLAGIADMGPILPMCSNIEERDHGAVAQAAATLMAAETEFADRSAAE
ncbi:MAG: dihydrodipicolinate synthase family protein, partial [Alphaproteobacteria bacterium]